MGCHNTHIFFSESTLGLTFFGDYNKKNKSINQQLFGTTVSLKAKTTILSCNKDGSSTYPWQPIFLVSQMTWVTRQVRPRDLPSPFH